MVKKTTKKSVKTSNTSVKTKRVTTKTVHAKKVNTDTDTSATIVVHNSIKYTPKVSVIIPVYNVEKYLPECLDSILNQTLKEIEIICVDDESTDGSLEILKEYAKKDNRITVMTQKNSYCNVARNNAINIAKGEYIGFIDPDDYINKCYYADLYTEAKKHDADISATGLMKCFDEHRSYDKNLGLGKNSAILTSIEERKNLILRTGSSVNKIYRRSFFNQNHILFYPTRSPGGDNYVSCMSVILCDKIAVCSKACYYYRQLAGSVVHKKKTVKSLQICDVYKQILHDIKATSLPTDLKLFWNNIVTERFCRDVHDIMGFCDDDLKEQFILKTREVLPEIIVSLTSYPARIGTVHKTIETLLNQTLKADKVILWLAPEQFPNRERDLPKQLLDLCDKGLTIDWYHDIRSYKKLIPALQKYPESFIVTADDDLLYPDFWLRSLYDCYLTNPNIIWCHRAHKVSLNYKNEIQPYKTWLKTIQNLAPQEASFAVFCTTGGGVLYPPRCFYKDVLNEKDFMALCPNADDIWFWAMLILNGQKIQTVNKPMINLVTIDGTQEDCLWTTNQTANDIQIANLVKKYPQILTILPKTTEISKKSCIKSYILFPYYVLATIWMNLISLPLAKFKRHIKQVMYSHSTRGRMEKLENRILQQMHVETNNQTAQLEKQINLLQNHVSNAEQMLINLYTLKNNQIKNKLEYRTFGDLAHCIRTNVYKIPNNIDLVVGVPRSGMIPAYMIALFMNKKCCSLDEFISGVQSSNGFRNIIDKPVKNVLVVDDSIYSGREMTRVKEKLSKFKKYNFKYMAVYAKTESADLVDIYFEIVDGKRVWQWNYLNSASAERACFDMDGVLCVDPTDEQNDDGKKYEHFIQTAQPLYIPTYKIRAIVTSRLEKYRALTEKWLSDNGVQYGELIMLDLPTAKERRKSGCHAQFKANVYKKMEDASIFIASSSVQAQEIAARTGKQVLCVENDELY